MELDTRPALLDLLAVSERTQLSKSSLYRLIAAGHLKGVRVGRALRITEQELARFIAGLESGELKI